MKSSQNDNSKSNSKSKYLDDSIFHSMDYDPTDKIMKKDPANVECEDMLEIQMKDEQQVKQYFELKVADKTKSFESKGESGFSDIINMNSNKSSDILAEKSSHQPLQKDSFNGNSLSVFKDFNKKRAEEKKKDHIRVFDEESDTSPIMSFKANPLLEDSQDDFNTKFFKKLEEAKASKKSTYSKSRELSKDMPSNRSVQKALPNSTFKRKKKSLPKKKKADSLSMIMEERTRKETDHQK